MDQMYLLHDFAAEPAVSPGQLPYDWWNGPLMTHKMDMALSYLSHLQLNPGN